MAAATKPFDEQRVSPDPVLDRICDRVLWLAVRMIHEANHVRPNLDGLKVGGHQASSASVVTILATLYLRWLRSQDLVSVKPHASPVYHSIAYLLGALEEADMERLRAFGGLQSYPSRTKDPDRVDFSTGSVGLGAVAPLFASLADQYLRDHVVDFATSQPERRFVALVGDAELDEGNVWEAALDPILRTRGNVTLIVDLNRQSLDRVIPGERIGQLQAMFAAAGWQVVEAKYGSRLQRLMRQPNGDRLRRRIDEMSNEEYQSLVRKSNDEARESLIAGCTPKDRRAVEAVLGDPAAGDLQSVLRDLGGHDSAELMRALNSADAERSRASIVFAYTIKGWHLPFAADAMNHSALMATDQISGLADDLGADADRPWARFPITSAEGALCAARGQELGLTRRPGRLVTPHVENWALDVRISPRTSTQQVFGDALASLARTAVGERVVTASPDVTISTSLGGWVSRVGLYGPPRSDAPAAGGPISWTTNPSGRHIEFGISEMNLFMWLSQFGLAADLLDHSLVPIGTVYDPFVCRGLDALIYALYVGARFVLVGTPSGIALAPEGGAHQSTVTTSLGIELPGLVSYEPAFGQEVAWMLEDGIRSALAGANGHSTYLRLTTRAVDQSLAGRLATGAGEAAWKRDALQGGYCLIDGATAGLPAGSPSVTIAASGAVVPEAIEATEYLLRDEVAASLVVITSAERLSAELHDSRLEAIRSGRPATRGQLDILFPRSRRAHPLVTVVDGASHSLSFLGSAVGGPVVPLGADTFGQSGTIGDLHAFAGVDTEHIIGAALVALELAADG